VPRISIVVPVCNVAPYLQTCLQSLAQQTVSDLEIVMVDDGSTDESRDIAERFVTGDRRFRLLRQPNAGLGAARNAGIEVSRGEFISFVDGDDVVPRHAYEVLIGALDRTGSDFSSGNVRRLTSLGTTRTFLARAFERTQLQTHIVRSPDLVVDRIACNKLFRRSFWDRHGFRFPEGVLYEDIAVILPAHYLASSVDALEETVYLWRRRERDDLSITQRRTEPKALRDRVTAVDYVSRFLADRGLTKEKLHYDTSVVAHDLKYFLDVLDRADDEYRDLFLELVNDFLDRADSRVLEQPLAIDRLKWQLVRRRALPELLEALRFEVEDLDQSPPVRSLRRWYGDYPYRNDRRLRIPRRVFRLHDELQLIVGVNDLRWEGETLRIEGYAYVELIGAPHKRSQKVDLLVRRVGARWRSLRIGTEEVYRPDVTAAADGPVANLDWCGFRATFDARQLQRRGRWQEGSWEVGIVVRAEDVTRSAWQVEAAPLHAVPAAEFSIPGGHVRAGVGPMGTLTVRVHRPRTIARSLVLDDGVLQLEGDVGSGRGKNLVLSVRRRVGTATLDYPVHVERSHGQRRFLARVPIHDLVREVDIADQVSHVEQRGDGIDWDLYLADRRRQWRLILDEAVPESTWSFDGREIAVHRTRFGNLTVVERLARPVVNNVEWSSTGSLALSGSFQGPPGDYDLILRDRRSGVTYLFPFQHGAEEGRFAMEVEPGAVVTLGGARPLAEGQWEFLVSARGRGADTGVSAKLDHSLFGKLPISTTIASKRFQVGVRGYDLAVLEVERDLEEDERGRFRQKRLQTVFYRAQREGSLRDAVLYECFNGRAYADSPRVVHQELVRRKAPLEHLWVVRDGGWRVPDTAVPVRELSKEYYEAYGRARFVVTNDYWPRWAFRRSDQIWLQTWHGAPVKSHGCDLAGRPSAVDEYRRALQQAAENWQFVVSPGAFATPILAGAFPFGAEVIEAGLPRTDTLLRSDRERLADEVKRRLGLPTGKRVVLYAPTYRDHLADDGGYRLGPLLDLDALHSALAADHVVLFRKHRLVNRALPAGAGRFVLDVSEYPDSMELLLVADVLVTDYSSAIFDFASTGRPMVFFTPDLEAYRDEIRGFSIDFESVAPGPLLRTTEEVVDALLQEEAVRAEFAERYERFLATYCALNDGRAASRVVDRVFAW
jgi:CDP-glycerol glycerophosphotransferase